MSDTPPVPRTLRRQLVRMIQHEAKLPERAARACLTRAWQLWHTGASAHDTQQRLQQECPAAGALLVRRLWQAFEHQAAA